MDSEPFDLQRFVDAQDPVIEHVYAELAAGAKTSHWMWFVFPQLQRLGRSATARHFGLSGLAEARAYWRHPVLGPRLAHCTRLVLGVRERSALQIFGAVDEMKFRSSMTLFEQAAGGDEPCFGEALQRFFDGRCDALTLQLLA